MKKLMIASPCYQGKCDTSFTLSLIQSLYILDHAGIQAQILLPETGSILAKERNDIVEAFWQSDCTHLLCIDSDVSWQPDAPMKFLNYDVDFIAGVYPARRNTPNIPKYLFNPETDANGQVTQDEKTKLLKMKGVPAGFMMLSKKCIETMRNHFPEKQYKGSNNFDSAFSFFNTEVRDGYMWGEDYVFCQNAIDAGIDIWCDPSINFVHAGIPGNLNEILTSVKPINNNVYEFKTTD
jgi:hypothetical protein